MPWVVARPVHHLPADADVGVDEVGSAAGHADADHSALGLPESPDVLAMLRHQAAVTCEGMVALVDWANAEPDAAQRVRDCEHRADDTKRELRLALTNAFITPIDAEDLYVMSERLDAVLNGAKDTVRESEVMASHPTRPWRRWRRCWPKGSGISPRRSSGWTPTSVARTLPARPRRRMRR